MSSSRGSSPSALVQNYFDSVAGYWQDVYRNTGLRAYIYQRRAAFTLNWIRELNLAPGERCLDVGCGAGILSATLASWDYRVDAIDRGAEHARTSPVRSRAPRSRRSCFDRFGRCTSAAVSGEQLWPGRRSRRAAMGG